VRLFWRAVAAAALAGGLVCAAAWPAQAAGHAAVSYNVTIKATSGYHVGHDVLVVYKSTTFNSARIKGQISGAVSGDVATLYAKWFGATSFAATRQTVALTGVSPQSYSFVVRPKLATQYRVVVTTGTTADAKSAIKVVYVTTGGQSSRSRTSCSRRTCTYSWRSYVLVPAAAYRTEIHKHWYLYLGVRRSRTRKPPPPKYIYLTSAGRSSRPRRVGHGQYEITFIFHIALRRQSANWIANACTKDTETRDGIGLPGHHLCGNRRLRVGSFNYLG
jgi:hypothetical protein